MKTFSKILFIASDGSADQAAFRNALELSQTHQADLTVAGIVDDMSTKTSGPDLERLQTLMIEERSEQLKELVSKTAPGSSIPAKVLVGKPVPEVLREVQEGHYDLIVKRPLSPHAATHFFGSTDLKLLRHCPCPVWMSHGDGASSRRVVLAAVDRDEQEAENNSLAQQIVQLAAGEALGEFAELHVVHTWRLEYESFLRSPRVGMNDAEVEEMAESKRQEREAWLQGLVDTACNSLAPEATEFLQPVLHLNRGDARRVVPDLVDELDANLLVMGTVGRKGIKGMLIGNTAEKILGQISCSVLAIKPEGFTGSAV